MDGGWSLPQSLLSCCEDGRPDRSVGLGLRG